MVETLFDELISLDNLKSAWIRVSSNMGSAGIDKISLEEFQSNLNENLYILQKLLKDGEYKPLPLLIIDTRKQNGDTRVISIPAIRDRVVQGAHLNVLQPIFEGEFLDCSFAYRPGRGAYKALNRVEKLIKKGFQWVVDADIASFFDEIDQKLLLEFIKEKVNDRQVIELIEKLLAAEETELNKGIAQGSVISPLFSNIYLHNFDKRIVGYNYNLIRYADDFVILETAKEKAEEALMKSIDVLKELYLRLNEEKTKITSLKEGFVFLGYEFNEKGKFPSKSALQSFLEKIYQEVYHPYSREKITNIINGWKGYFKLEELSLKEVLEKVEELLNKEPDSIPLRIVFAATLIEFNKIEEAKDIIQKIDSKESQDARIHYEIAMLCTELGLDSEAFEELLTASRIEPDSSDYTYNLALLYIRKKRFDQAVRFLQRTIEINPGFSKAYQVLGFLYQKLKLTGLSHMFLKRAGDLSKEVINGLDLSDSFNEFETIDLINSDMINQANCTKIISLFSGREGVYAHELIDNRGKIFYIPVKEPLKEEQIQSHLKGEVTLAVYTTRMDSTVVFLVIDIDTKRSIWEQCADDEEKRRELELKTEEDAKNIISLGKKLGVPIYLENTGGRGRHCWIFFSEPIEAKKARDFVKLILKKVDPPPDQVAREIFPKQDFVSKEALGSLICLPLGINKKTGRRSFFIDERGNPFPDQLGFLKTIKTFSKPDPKKVIEALTKEEAPKKERLTPEIENMIKGCNVIRFLINKAKKTKDLTHTERLVLLYTFGHLGEAGKNFIHSIISNCTNYDYKYTQKWIMRLDKNKNPISCPKIRDWLSYITPAVGCYCKFDLKENMYPTPLIYANYLFQLVSQEILPQKIGNDSPVKELKLNSSGESSNSIKNTSSITGKIALSEAEDEINKILKNYIEAKKSKREVEEKIMLLEIQLKKFFEGNNINSIETDFGILKKIEANGKVSFVIEI